ncbi:internal scaffolding protein [Microviridae sp.]|nr:internal scaffolding protein [Microviridae sp.]
MTKIRKPYDKPVRVSFATVGESRTKQASKKECDMNHIMRKAARTGLVDHVSRYQGRYGDFVGPEDYHQAVNVVIAADNMFASLPAAVRGRFDNDPSAFLDFVQNPENSDELVSMGLKEAPMAPTEAAPSTLGEVGDSAEGASEAPSGAS